MRAFWVVLLAVVPAASAAPRPEVVAPAKLDDTCVDAGCKKKALDHFTAALALQRAGKQDRPLRVSFIGDSLTASDGISSALRDKLGALVGAGGPGFVFAERPHPFCQNHSVSWFASGSWQIFGVSTNVPADRLLGLGGSIEGSGTVRFVPVKPIASVDVHYLEQPNGGTFEIVADNTPLDEVATASPAKHAAFRRVAVPVNTKRIELRAKSHVRLFGASLEAAKGAVVDNLGVVNATAKGMSKYNLPDHLRNQLAHRGADLVIVMLGTNEAEWLSPVGAGMVEHEQVFGELLASVRAANAETSCLVISPLDQIDYRLPNAPARVSVPAMVEAQHRAATAHGCAFWNIYDWMGGKGSSMTWFKRGLVVKDFQHPTTQGAIRIADALYSGLVR
ncbi:MAG: GDSL-type esterase/lipase family protein [Kofleriaceae bacterium]